MPATKTVSAGLLVRTAEILDPGKPAADGSMRFDVTWTTGARGRRTDFWTGQEWEEELEVSESAIRMSRINSGRAPVLDSHSAWGFKSVLGVVERAWIEGNTGKATLRISGRPELEGLRKDIADRIVNNVSVGYRVHKFKDVTPPGEENIRRKRAIDWEPWEVSLVPTGFDDGAHRRHEEQYPCELDEEGTMPKNTTDAGTTGDTQRTPDAGSIQAPAAVPAQVAAAAPPASVAPEVLDQTRKAAVEGEMARQRSIRSIVSKAGLESSVADDLCERGIALEAAKDAVFERLAARSQQFPANGARVEMGADGWDKFRAGLQNALEHRVGHIGDDKLTPEGRELRGLRMMEAVRESLRVRHLPIVGTQNELIHRAYVGMQGTTDLANIFSNVANKSLKRGWTQVPSTYRAIARKKNVSDFKQFTIVGMGEGANFLSITEHGEIQFSKVTDSKETGKLKTAGRGVTFTREALINDDLDALSRVPGNLGAAGARYENETAWALLTSNVTLGDGVVLFHAATHKNLQTGGGSVLAEAGLSDARKAMRTQKAPDGNATLNVMAKTLIVPAALETTAQRLMTSIVAAESGKVNPFAGRFEVLCEPLLDANSLTAFYLAADPETWDILQYGYLDGQEGPQFESETDLTTLGVRMVAYMDFYVMVLDYRGLDKSAGV